jgi:uncharacterized RDD family membrane protein YckC
VEPHYVGFWARVLAALIDSICLGIVIYPVAYLVYGAVYFEPGGPWFRGPLDVVLNLVFPVMAVLLFWVYRSATPGKMVLRARIVDASTLQAPAKWQLLVRYLGYYLSMLPLGLGMLWVGWDDRKQGFHDKLARTVVIYDSPA